MPSRKARVAIIVSHPIQHFVHLYRALAAETKIELRVIYASDIGARRYFDRDMGVEIAWKTDLFSGYDSVVLPESRRIDSTGFFQVDNPSVTKALAEFQPDAVLLHGYAQLTLLRALMWCRLRRVPALLWSDSSLTYQRALLKRTAKKLLVSLAMRQFRAVLTTGDNNAKYYRHYGVCEERLFRCPFTIDEASFAKARHARNTVRASLRERYGIPADAFVPLFVGKLTPIKRPGDLLDALVILDRPDAGGKEIVAFFAGDGPLGTRLQVAATTRGLPAIFGGFINVDVLPSIYAMADALVFPSGFEPYGLAAREAICVGLPLIVSDQIGCIGPTDAARPGKNAIVYPAGDARALSRAIASLSSNAELSRRMSHASLDIAEELKVDTSVTGFLSAIQAVSPC
jgi:glycosyltransferase involved in cell wall biosynthesis